jgi:hypothetical protein
LFEVLLNAPWLAFADEESPAEEPDLEMGAKWRFKPALDANDNPVAVKVVMPVRVVKYGKVYRALASLDFDEEQKDES